MKEREKEDVEALDAAVDRMRKFLTAGPYIETIDQDKDDQYRYHDRPSSEAWLKDTPFSRQEHYTVQYQTWNYKEWGTDLIQLRVHSQYEDKPKESAKVKEETRSAVGTPQVGPKKKISLSAYKDKKANGGFDTPAPDLKQASRDGAQNNSGRNHVKDEIHKEDMATLSQIEKTSGDGTLKRKREEHQPRNNGQAGTPTKRTRAVTPERRKIMPTSSQDPQSTSDNKRRRDVDDEDGELPARLSPLGAPDLPARLSPITRLPSRLSPELPDRMQLPSRLSPSLPDNVLAELDKRAKSRTAAGAEDQPVKHDSVRSNSRKQEEKDQVRSDSSERVELAPKKSKRESDESHTEGGGTRKEVEEANNVKQESTTSSRKQDKDEMRSDRLLIRFKIPKRLRQDYRRLLQFPARPAKAVKHELSSDDVRNTEPVKQAEAKVKSEKRASTPVEPAINNSPETTKTIFATPSCRRENKDARIHASRVDDHTATSSPALPDATPLSASSGAPRPSPATSTTRTALSESWLAEKSRLVALGKSLKKTAQHLSSTSSSSTTAETSALTNIESLLAFILAFHAHDMSYATRQPSVAVAGLDPCATWCTLHGFWRFVHSVCAPWPALQGLVAGLGEAYCAHVLAWCALHPNGAGGGGAGASAATNNGKSDEAAEIIATLSRIAAQNPVSLRSMRELFPETWKRGFEGASADDRDDVRPGAYDGPFDLPVGMQSGTLPAVRAAVYMLREWKCRDGKKFEMTLKLKR